MKQRLLRIGALTIGLLLLTFLLLALRAQPVSPAPFFQLVGDDVLVIAHQGGEHLWPSNTLLAFDNAVALGVDVLEMDIHATADGVLVVMHDETVDRTTDGSGLIKEMAYADLQQLDAGYYWTEDDSSFPFRGQGIQVPALQDVFAAHPQMPMNIEIKQREPSIVAAFCALLDAYNMKERVLVASFHPETMQEFRQNCPGVATSMVEPEIRLLYGLNLARLGRLFAAPAEAIQAPEYSGDIHVLQPRFVHAAQQHGVDVHAWTINDVETMQRLIDAGVDGLITDRPDLALTLLGRGGMND